VICFLFPHPYADPPEGQYCTLDIEEGSGWNNVTLGGDVQDPYKTLELIRAVNPTVVVPHSEEAVICAGLANTELGLPGVSLDTAIACTSRVTQRERLEEEGLGMLNPRWCPLTPDSCKEFSKFCRNLVVKAPVSTLSRGVALVDQYDDFLYIDQQLRRRCYDLIAKLKRVFPNPISILEDYVEGDAVEISGIVASDGEVKHWFRELHQEWQDNRIKKYRPTLDTNMDLRSYGRKIVKAFDMKNCGFSIEFKGPPWKVMEVHCRLGEDGGDYEELISPKKSSAQWLYETICL
jgi:hypothetical protein